MIVIRVFIGLSAVLAGLSVAFGAFSAHALKAKLSDHALSIFETGARYQMYHALGLLLVAILLILAENSNPYLVAAGIAFLVGILLFSGSLYALSLTGISWLGAITPIGGVAFIAGWGCVAAAALHFKV
jgi:uncharacterized membrane protein YgdD (TMEM256/DUF423 family)